MYIKIKKFVSGWNGKCLKCKCLHLAGVDFKHWLHEGSPCDLSVSCLVSGYVYLAISWLYTASENFIYWLNWCFCLIFLFSSSLFFSPRCCFYVVPKHISCVGDLLVANPSKHECKWDDPACVNKYKPKLSNVPC